MITGLTVAYTRLYMYTRVCVCVCVCVCVSLNPLSLWHLMVSTRHPPLCRVPLHSERRGGIATAPPLRRSYSDRAVTSPGGAFHTDTNLANHRHRTRLLADCQWRCPWRCGLGRLRKTRSLTKTIPRDRRKLIKLMLRKWTFLPPRSHLIRQFVKRHLVTLRREQHVLAQWLSGFVKTTACAVYVSQARRNTENCDYLLCFSESSCCRSNDRVNLNLNRLKSNSSLLCLHFPSNVCINNCFSFL